MKQMHQTKSFALGCIVMTAAVADQIERADIQVALRRHARCDWGTVCPEDAQQNELALRQGERLLSVYADRHDTCFYIITDADRSVTTVLLPSDY